MTSPADRFATPRMAAGVLFEDHRGYVLLVKPTYKTGWDIPGGYVEVGESPKDAARREVREELGLQIEVGSLLVVDWAPHPDEGDKLLFIFDGAGQLTDTERYELQASEIQAAEFTAPDLLAARLPPRLLRRLDQARRRTGDFYLEHGSTVHEALAGQMLGHIFARTPLDRAPISDDDVAEVVRTELRLARSDRQRRRVNDFDNR